MSLLSDIHFRQMVRVRRRADGARDESRGQKPLFIDDGVDYKASVQAKTGSQLLVIGLPSTDRFVKVYFKQDVRLATRDRIYYEISPGDPRYVIVDSYRDPAGRGLLWVAEGKEVQDVEI
jgi:hypothetical protein